MKKELFNEEKKELMKLCEIVRGMVKVGEYGKCYSLLKEMIGKYPHAPEPHNLLGMLLEKEKNHLLAMKHFRVAWDLDPTYLPARHNLRVYGTLLFKGKGAFNEADCPKLKEDNEHKIEYDEDGIGHIIRRLKNDK